MIWAITILVYTVVLAPAKMVQVHTFEILKRNSCEGSCKDTANVLGTCFPDYPNIDGRAVVQCVCNLGDNFFSQYNDCLHNCEEYNNILGVQYDDPQDLKNYYCDIVNRHSSDSVTSKVDDDDTDAVLRSDQTSSEMYSNEQQTSSLEPTSSMGQSNSLELNSSSKLTSSSKNINSKVITTTSKHSSSMMQTESATQVENITTMQNFATSMHVSLISLWGIILL